MTIASRVRLSLAVLIGTIVAVVLSWILRESIPEDWLPLISIGGLTVHAFTWMALNRLRCPHCHADLSPHRTLIAVGAMRACPACHSGLGLSRAGSGGS